MVITIWVVPLGVDAIERSVGFLEAVQEVDRLIASVRPILDLRVGLLSGVNLSITSSR